MKTVGEIEAELEIRLRPRSEVRFSIQRQEDGSWLGIAERGPGEIWFEGGETEQIALDRVSAHVAQFVA